MTATSSPPGASKRKRGPVPLLALLGLALLLPALSLIPLGSIWLWQKGYVLHWAVISFAIAGAAFMLLRRALKPLASPRETDEAVAVPSPVWDARQEAAWREVTALAQTADTGRLSGRDELMGLALETVTLVAKTMHPERSDPLLRFTLPEAFAVIEQASAGLRDFAETSLPFGDRVTVAQMMWIYRWRGAIPIVEKGYDLWRLVRLINPIAAATQELRERATRQIYELGRAHVARRLTEAFVKEVGKAAIDLYGGSVRVRSDRIREHVSEATRRDTQLLDDVAAEPVRILVAGQSGAGKSSLINALTGSLEASVDVVPATTRTTAYRVAREGLLQALLIDTPGIGPAAEGDAELVEAAADADMIIWVLSATRAARAADKAAMDAVRQHLESQHRAAPPTVVALTHIDRLRPFNDWSPPIDLVAQPSEKAQNIRAAVDAAVRDLALAPQRVAAVRADAQPYNIDALWALVLEALPEAKRARLQRCVRGVRGDWSWRAALSQAANAGRLVARTVLQSGDR
ncbi:MAG: GTPase [Hyphomicrobiaceae bacterium]|nr:GTPase [Hyphomicrobiaceae bacterium]